MTNRSYHNLAFAPGELNMLDIWPFSTYVALHAHQIYRLMEFVTCLRNLICLPVTCLLSLMPCTYLSMPNKSYFVI